MKAIASLISILVLFGVNASASEPRKNTMTPFNEITDLSPQEFRARLESRFRPQNEAIRRAAARINAEFPELRKEIIERADEAMKGMPNLANTPVAGDELTFIGNPPLWHKHGALNRMIYWRNLLQAYSLTGDEAYARKVVEELRNWMAACPRPALEEEKVFGGGGM